MNISALNSLINNVDLILSKELIAKLDHFLKSRSSSEKEYEKAIKFPESISKNQLNRLIEFANKNDAHFKINRLYPNMKISFLKPILSSNGPDEDVGFTLEHSPPIRMNIHSISDKFLSKLSRDGFRMKPSRINEQFRNNFNLFTYFDTKPIIPKLIQTTTTGPNSEFLHGLAEKKSDKIDLLLQHFCFFPIQIQTINGLSKQDKLDLLIKINNECSLRKSACRIVYLQSLSIMTFWMALKAKEISNDKWNSIGYQITLESKTSLNNSIIFFEIATFIRVLNRDLDMSLITHLIIDVGQSHLFFNLLFLYLKENIQSLRHLKIFILTQDVKQSQKMVDYFEGEIAHVNFAQDYDSYTNQSNLEYFYLDDIYSYELSKQKIKPESRSGTTPTDNVELIIYECWQEKVEVFKLVEFFHIFPWQINYQCERLNGITPLIVSVVKGNHDDVYQLLALGADCRVRSWDNLEPIQWAIRYNQEKIFQLLFTHQYTINPSLDLDLHHSYLFKYSLTPPNNVPVENFTNYSKTSDYEVNYELILRLLPSMVKQIYCSTTKAKMENQSSLGSILIMLPSYNNVSTLRKLIISTLSDFEYQFTIFCLYPNVPNNELDAGIGILSSTTNQVRVILSTFNVDSLLFKDIHFVINTGVRLEKTHTIFSSTNLYRLIANKTSDVETKNILRNQNKKPVIVYNLYRKYDSLNMFSDDLNDSIINLSTDSMYHCIFAAKYFNFKNNKTIDIFERMISQPRKEIISNALDYLKNINVLNESEELTELGKILIDLSIEPHYAKMIIFSVILRCLDPILTIVCSLSSPNIANQNCKISNIERNENQICNLNSDTFRNYSDHLNLVYAFQKWQEICRSNTKSNNIKMNKMEGFSVFESFSSFEMIYSLRTKILGQLRAIGFVKGKGSMNIRFLNGNSDNFALVKAAICAGQPLDHFAKTCQSQPNRCIGPITDEIIYVDPNSSLNLHQKDVKLPTNLVLFDRKISCGQISYIQNCTLISPLTMAIFLDEPIYGPSKIRNDSLEINGIYSFFGENIEKVFYIRQRWQNFVKKRLFSMQQVVSEEDENFLLDLIELISDTDVRLGFGSHPCIGRAPQVMSTYFCSTILIQK